MPVSPSNHSDKVGGRLFSSGRQLAHEKNPCITWPKSRKSASRSPVWETLNLVVVYPYGSPGQLGEITSPSSSPKHQCVADLEARLLPTGGRDSVPSMNFAVILKSLSC